MVFFSLCSSFSAEKMYASENLPQQKMKVEIESAEKENYTTKQEEIAKPEI